MTIPEPHREPVVLGGELAAARSVEDRQVSPGPSPIDETTYDREALGLWRWTDSYVDEIIAAFVHDYVSAEPSERRELTARLTMADLYTMLSFARRRAFAAIRTGDPAMLVDAFDAISTVEVARVDYRDVIVAAMLATGAAPYTSTPATTAAAGAIGRAGPKVDAIISKQVDGDGHDRLRACGYRAVPTPAGPVLVDDGREPYDPEHDLAPTALALAREIEAGGTYLVTEVGAVKNVPAVWLVPPGGPPPPELTRLSARARVRGEPSPTTGYVRADGHFLLVWLVEAASAEDAATIAAAADRRHMKGAVIFGHSADRLAAVVVASNSATGRSTFEDSDTMTRYRPLVERALTAS